MKKDWNNPKYCLEAVKQNGYALEYVKEQTPEICLEAVKQNGLALEDVKEQTIDICLQAVKQKGRAFRFVKNQTPLIIHYLKKYNMSVYKLYKENNRITISDKEMEKFYNENPHLLLTL